MVEIDSDSQVYIDPASTDLSKTTLAYFPTRDFSTVAIKPENKGEAVCISPRAESSGRKPLSKEGRRKSFENERRGSCNDFLVVGRLSESH